MAEFPLRWILRISCAAFLGLPGPALALDPVAYEAEYEVYINGKPRMETRVTMTRSGDAWLLENASEGTRGLPRFLKVRSSEHSRIDWRGDTIRPLDFSHHSRYAGRDERWEAAFRWDRGTVNTVHEEGESSLDLQDETYDPLSLTLALRRNLEQDRDRWQLNVVDEDEIEVHDYAAGPAETLQTALGCLEVIPVERVRENSRRYSKSWHAPAFAWLPVRLRHGKTGDREFEMRLRQLKLAGQAATTVSDCP